MPALFSTSATYLCVISAIIMQRYNNFGNFKAGSLIES